MKPECPPMDYPSMHVAYFSMEIGINADMPTYSGGLGILAGDMLRSASDLKLPVIGVSLLYRKGYFRQVLDDHGNQSEAEVFWDPAKHMIPLPNRISVEIEGREVFVQAWLYPQKGITGHVNPIIFLDTGLPENHEYARTITDHLYGNDQKYRLCQEIVLGIGGVRMLESIGCDIKKFHMNEGHSALLALELNQKIQDKSQIRKKCVFTTHTPVASGHDEFDAELANKLIGSALLTPHVKKDIIKDKKMNMTRVGLCYSKFVNGVAKRHGEVSREMFPGFHIESITNGVHSGYWTAEPFKELFTRYVPSWVTDVYSLRYMLGIPKKEIWKAHKVCKKILIDYVNKSCGASMDCESFTIGFARRAATYKRGDMFFKDIERLKRIAKKVGKIQIIYGGKAHPKDQAGKDMIKRIFGAMKNFGDSVKVCYVENYDINIAKILLSGSDIWLNTPTRPKEASGTSGMKAAHNGVPHFSILDGWWIEGHIEDKTGWSIGPKTEENNTDADAEDMYDKLEYVILPKFYKHSDEWVDVMRNAIAINGSFFNSHRMIQQYVSNAYFD